MRFKRNRPEEIRLGIAPLIDIVFLLLIFFMVTAHFDVASGVQIRLPRVAQKTFLPKELFGFAGGGERGQSRMPGGIQGG